MSQFLGLSNDDVKTIGAGATTVGVLLALFGPAVRHWWRGPLLSMDYEAKRGDPYWDHVSLEGDVFFLRVRVRNLRGCDAARDAQVIVSSYRAADLGLEGRALEWSGQRPLGETPVTTTDIAPGMERHVDVVQIGRKQPEAAGGDQANPAPVVIPEEERSTSADEVSDAPGATLVARLCVYPKPWGHAHLVPKGDHDVVVTITASNANPVSYRFAISYAGDASAKLLAPPERLRRRTISEVGRGVAKWLIGAYRR